MIRLNFFIIRSTVLIDISKTKNLTLINFNDFLILLLHFIILYLKKNKKSLIFKIILFKYFNNRKPILILNIINRMTNASYFIIKSISNLFILIKQ